MARRVRDLAAYEPTRRGATVRIQYKVTDSAPPTTSITTGSSTTVLDAKLGTIGNSDFAITNTYEDAAKIQ